MPPLPKSHTAIIYIVWKGVPIARPRLGLYTANIFEESSERPIFELKTLEISQMYTHLSALGLDRLLATSYDSLLSFTFVKKLPFTCSAGKCRTEALCKFHKCESASEMIGRCTNWFATRMTLRGRCGKCSTDVHFRRGMPMFWQSVQI